MAELDLTITQNHITPLTFNIQNPDGSIYDLTGAIVVFNIYPLGGDSPMFTIPCTTSIPLGVVNVVVGEAESIYSGIFEYRLIDTAQTITEPELQVGNLTIVQDLGFSDTIEAYILIETPGGLTITPEFQTQKIRYWSLFLKPLVHPPASIEYDFSQDAWDSLQKSLIAKLVIYDALLLAAKGSFIAFTRGSSSSQNSAEEGGIKKIVTGPSEVEFFNMADSIKNIFTPKNGLSGSPFEILTQDVCTLASRLRIRLPMCQYLSYNPIIPRKYKNPEWHF